MSARYHVYPVNLDADDIVRVGYAKGERIVNAPHIECALCRTRKCVQTTDPDDLIIMHGLSALN